MKFVWTVVAAAIFFPRAITCAQELSQNQQRERIAVTRRVFVHSTALLVRAAVVEDKLLKLSAFRAKSPDRNLRNRNLIQT